MSTAADRPGSSRRLIVAVLALLFVSCGALRAAEADRIAEILCLEAGARVADVGAGDGDWTEVLARRVGETGHVYATEVDEDLVAELRERMEEEGLENVTVVLGDQESTGLPEDCCDAVLLRMVYHHFTDAAKMRAGLKRALRPGGLIAIVDIVPQERWRDLEDVPERGGHGILERDLVADMTADGFQVVSRHEDWNDDEDRYCVVFRRP
jgi:SAM-dependent methyltransferase